MLNLNIGVSKTCYRSPVINSLSKYSTLFNVNVTCLFWTREKNQFEAWFDIRKLKYVTTLNTGMHCRPTLLSVLVLSHLIQTPNFMSPRERSCLCVSYSVTAATKMELTVLTLGLLLTRWVCDGRMGLAGGAEECEWTHADQRWPPTPMHRAATH